MQQSFQCLECGEDNTTFLSCKPVCKTCGAETTWDEVFDEIDVALDEYEIREQYRKEWW